MTGPASVVGGAGYDAVGNGPRDVAPPRAIGRTGSVPLLLVVPAVVGVLFLVLPLGALLVRAPWTGLPELLAGPSVRQALRLSLLSAGAATVLSLLFGVPLAWTLARLRFRGRRLLRTLVTLPLVLPPVVGGVGLLYAFSGPSKVGAQAYFFTFVGARILHSIFYLWGRQPFRTLCFAIGALATIGMAVHVLRVAI